MKPLVAMVLIFLASAPPAFCQQRRPTLGPSTPTLGGPGTGRTVNRKRLLSVRKIYIESIDHKLSEKIREDLAGSTMLRVVDKPKDADAVLRGTCFRSSRLKHLHSEVYLTKRVSGAPVWQDVVYVPWNPPGLGKAVDKSAAEIVTHLFQSIRQAQR